MRGTAKAQGLAYSPTDGDEVEDLLLLLADVQRRFPEVRLGVLHALHLKYMKKLETLMFKRTMMSVLFEV